MPQQRPVLILYGPTASGKSALAMKIARKHGAATIINADSMQLYQGLSILTACPTEAEMAEIPHRLFAYLDPARPCSVGIWLEAARIAIYETWQQGRLPILVGGTGMYIKALIHGIAPIPDVSEKTRETVRQMTVFAAYSHLQKHDPVMAAKLNAGDSQRVFRALEVLEETGKSLSYWQAQPTHSAVPEADFRLHALTMDRDKLYARCNHRLEMMLQQGALDELRTMLARNLPATLPAMRAVGVPELARHLAGEWALADALEKAQQATRNYAKRQLTWQRHQLPDATLLAFPYDPLPASATQF